MNELKVMILKSSYNFNFDKNTFHYHPNQNYSPLGLTSLSKCIKSSYNFNFDKNTFRLHLIN